MRKGMAHIERLGRSITPARAQRMCFDKRQFPTKNEARDFSQRGARKYGNCAQEPYKCGLCGKFHLATVKAKRT